ncbi:MAG: MBL fold metallo-hydrolase [Bacteroidales bacterium]|nr:MBL fold metallo-hydrolase [Bacteroidales bacterium]
MKLNTIYAENFKIDGGACFGVVPKTIWGKFTSPDENNLLEICLRSLLIEDGNRLILIDAGIGDKQSEKFYSYQYITGRDNLQKSFNKAGYKFEDVTDVIFTHLHYDHCGGAVIRNKKYKFELLFKNAMHWCSKAQWNMTLNPNVINKASYYEENIVPIKEMNRLMLIEDDFVFTENVRLKIFNGHTEGQLIPFVHYKGKILVFVSDFIPSAAHIPLPYIAAFDNQPLVTLKEKENFYLEALKFNFTLFFEHDAYNECCTLKMTDKGIKFDKIFPLSAFTNE